MKRLEVYYTGQKVKETIAEWNNLYILEHLYNIMKKPRHKNKMILTQVKIPKSTNMAWAMAPAYVDVLVNVKYFDVLLVSYLPQCNISQTKIWPAVYASKKRWKLVDGRVITTSQPHSPKPELGFCAGSNPIHNGQRTQLEIRLNVFGWSAILPKAITYKCNIYKCFCSLQLIFWPLLYVHFQLLDWATRIIYEFVDSWNQ